MVDVWWGIVERETPGEYDFGAYSTLFARVRDAGLHLQVCPRSHSVLWRHVTARPPERAASVSASSARMLWLPQAPLRAQAVVPFHAAGECGSQ